MSTPTDMEARAEEWLAGNISSDRWPTVFERKSLAAEFTRIHNAAIEAAGVMDRGQVVAMLESISSPAGYRISPAFAQVIANALAAFPPKPQETTEDVYPQEGLPTADDVRGILGPPQPQALRTSEAENAACESALGYPHTVHSKPCIWPACELDCVGRKHRLSAWVAIKKSAGNCEHNRAAIRTSEAHLAELAQSIVDLHPSHDAGHWLDDGDWRAMCEWIVDRLSHPTPSAETE